MELFFEIGCEEIPASFVPPALQAMRELFEKAVKEAQLPAQHLRTLGTPRRLILIADGIPAQQEDREEEKLGPAVKSALDEQGQPTKPLLGFAKSQGVEVAQLERVSVQKNNQSIEYFRFLKKIPGRSSKEIVSEILTALVPKIPFKKTMRWGASLSTFARPIHWFCAILDGETIPVSFAEAGSAERIESGNKSYGHRFHSPTPFVVNNAQDFIDKARAGYVIVDPKERKEMIRAGIEALAKEEKAQIIPDDELLEQVSWLVEYPYPLVGSFEESHLQTPKEVLITSMKNHQRFFALEDASKKLLPRFITIAGTVPNDVKVVRAGNERVLRARLADASFFFQEDLKKTLATHGAGLANVLFQARLGTYAKKVQRMETLIQSLAAIVAPGQAEVLAEAQRAASLCKCDLLTGMVGEFPELQGIMGREYALRQGEPASVALAIEEHYLPRGEQDSLPQSAAGAIVALADKLDSVVSLFAIGVGPTGEKDFYGVRRLALGVLRIVLGRGLHLDIHKLSHEILANLAADDIKFAEVLLDDKKTKRTKPASEIADEIAQFFKNRVENYLTDEKKGLKLRVDVVSGVLSLGYTDLVDVAELSRELDAFAFDAQFEAFCDLAKRVRKIVLSDKSVENTITRSVAPAGGFVYPNLGEVNPTLFSHPAEEPTYQAFLSAKDSLPVLLGKRSFKEAIHGLAALIKPVDEFMNKGPMVLDKDPILKNNRVALCGQLDRLISSVANFEKIQATRSKP
jgi:glycyl-tRNA synthetase beta chain